LLREIEIIIFLFLYNLSFLPIILPNDYLYDSNDYHKFKTRMETGLMCIKKKDLSKSNYNNLTTLIYSHFSCQLYIFLIEP